MNAVCQTVFGKRSIPSRRSGEKADAGFAYSARAADFLAMRSATYRPFAEA